MKLRMSKTDWVIYRAIKRTLAYIVESLVRVEQTSVLAGFLNAYDELVERRDSMRERGLARVVARWCHAKHPKEHGIVCAFEAGHLGQHGRSTHRWGTCDAYNLSMVPPAACELPRGHPDMEHSARRGGFTIRWSE